MKNLILTLFLSLFWVASAQAQFSLETSSIENGATNIATDAVLSLTFNTAIDTSKHLTDREYNYFVRYRVTPWDTLQTGVATVSDDLMTLDIPLDLHPDRQYFFTLLEIYSADGERLNEPYFVRFATGDSISTGSVSGNVANLHDGGSTEGAVVVLVPRRALAQHGDDLPSDWDRPHRYARAAAIVDADGNYQIDYVMPGAYFAFAVNDVNDNGYFGIKDGDYAGFYTHGDNPLPNYFYVGDETEVEGINIKLINVDPELATNAASTIEAERIAHTWSQDAGLFSVGAIGKVDEDGQALGWAYAFFSPQKDHGLLLIYTGTTFIWGTSFQFPVDRFKDIPREFVASDVAVAKAEELGGAGFVAIHSNTKRYAVAFAGLVDEFYISRAVWRIVYKGVANAETDSVYYERKVFLIDALTGEELTLPNRTAHDAVAESDEVAAGWADDARLVKITAISPMDTLGQSLSWLIQYASDNQHRLMNVFVTGNGAYHSGVGRDSLIHYRPSIDPDYMDSDELLASSEKFSNFKARATDVIALMVIRADVNNFPEDDTLSLAYLQFAGRAGGRRVFDNDRLDAVTGEHYTLPHYLAFENSETAQAAADAWQAENQLIRIRSPRRHSVQNDGTSPHWTYMYSSPNSDSLFRVKVAGADLYSRAYEGDSLNVPALPALTNLIDSDGALRAASAYVDEETRSHAHLGRVSATLGVVRMSEDSTVTVWSIHFLYGSRRRIVIDAYTGEALNDPIKTTALMAARTARIEAKDWSRDAVLRYVRADSINEDGHVERWKFGFWSKHLLTGLIVEVTGGDEVTDTYEVDRLPRRFARVGAIHRWAESNRAMRQAERAFGQGLRRAGRLAYVLAELTNGSNDDASSDASKAPGEEGYWVFSYYDQDGNLTEVTVDGDDVTVVTANEDDGGEFTTNFALYQNYPNPFNPSTSIQYSLKTASHVTLEVYNVLGQKVATLVNGTVAASVQSVNFDASGLASGLYLYRIEAVDLNNPASRFVEVRKMILIK